jgi:hypothetical protein
MRLEATGTLELVEMPPSERVHRIELEAGRVAVVHAHPGARLGDFLGGRRLQVSGASGKTAAELWIDSGVDESAVLGALDSQRRARLEYLFSLDDAHLAFRPRRTDPVRGVTLRNLAQGEVLPGRSRFVRRSRVDASVSKSSLLGTLGLAPGASADDVKRAFRQLARELHPDRLGAADPDEREKLARRFAQISAVYHQLLR